VLSSNHRRLSKSTWLINCSRNSYSYCPWSIYPCYSFPCFLIFINKILGDQTNSSLYFWHVLYYVLGLTVFFFLSSQRSSSFFIASVVVVICPFAPVRIWLVFWKRVWWEVKLRRLRNDSQGIKENLEFLRPVIPFIVVLLDNLCVILVIVQFQYLSF